MNKAQQILLAVMVPIILLIIGYGFTTILKAETTGQVGRLSYLNGQYHSVKWNNFEKTWWVWLATFIIIGAIEYYIYNKTTKE